MKESDPSLFNGVCLRKFPPNADKSQIVELLLASGLPNENMDEIVFKSNGSVLIQNIAPPVCKMLIDNLNSTYHFDQKIHCNGIIPLTPQKASSSIAESEPTLPESEENDKQHKESPERTISPKLITTLGANPDISQYVKENEEQIEDPDAFILKHSLSARTPPSNSLAAELLDSRPSLDKANSLLTEVRRMSAKLSEYGSCVSTDEDSIMDHQGKVAEHDEFKTMSERARSRQKRKHRTPPKESFLKRPNIVVNKQ